MKGKPHGTRAPKLHDRKRVSLIIPGDEMEEARILVSYFADLYKAPASFNSVARMAIRELKERLDREMVKALVQSPPESMVEWNVFVKKTIDELRETNGIKKDIRKGVV